MVSFLDLGATYRELRSEIDAAVASVLDGGWYIAGDFLTQFEEQYARYCEAEYCVGLANGLDSLTLSLRAMGVGPGDEVIVPSHTYIATWLAVSAVGATPVPVEPDEQSFNLDAQGVKDALTSQTKAVMPVHLYGLPADIEAIVGVARDAGICVIEDAAQSHGASFQGTRIGAHGDVVAWSFYPGKNLGAFGDGGAVTTRDGDVAERIRVLRNYGSRERYVHEVQGVNSRLDPLQAAILSVKLRYLDEWNERRREIARRYSRELADTELMLPAAFEERCSAWHLYVVRTPDRDALQKRLADRGIGTHIHYPIPPFSQDAYKPEFLDAEFPLASRIARECLSLPIGPHLSEQDQALVVDAVRASVD